ncbi:MAG: DUF1320 domain-containing protein [Candidatus Sumerlaeaceae bacterium]|nr:DUF1320 domain-containing protein [Candidatus Sumerlaeaceae bacterium]
MYSTVSELQKRFSPGFLKLVADDNGDNSPDTAVMEQAIADADGRIDASLAARYFTPFGDPPPPLINELSSALAGQNLRRRLPQATAEWYHADFWRAENTLQRLADGTIQLPGISPLGRPITNLSENESPVFAGEALDEF